VVDAEPEHVRVLVCDDHEVYRLGLRIVLDRADDMTLAGEASTAADTLTQAVDASAQVVLVAQALARGGVLDLVRRLAGQQIGVVVLADSQDEDDLVDTLRAGARGYLTRRVAPDRLVDAIRAVACRQTALDSSVAGHLLHYLDDRPPAREADVMANGSCAELTERQRAVAALVAEGLSNAEIASRLYLSQATVKSHLTTILKRLRVRDRTQLAILVNRTALIDPPVWA
jgi:DNA-binding NarL/FixJ family response regulator